ncbi:MAG: molybdenum cofactor biosynthesis protein MoaE [Chloroflexi bacterium]|nr:molybdenum cofactor biosynthesis protein MoaE [Chloroflexota bacterium]
MRVQVRLFASYREAAGVGHVQVDLPEGALVKDAIRAVLRDHPRVAEGRQLIVAREREYVDVNALLADGDELALIPPVSGGATAAPPRIAVTSDPLSVDAVIGAVRGDGFGGVVAFLGTVRDRSRGKKVTHLAYEAYVEMAEGKMRQIAERLEQEHAPARVAMHHRIGDLAIGEIAVVVAAAAPHRDAAFALARRAIDELKSVVPIWKKEHTEDGAIWIEDHA